MNTNMRTLLWFAILLAIQTLGSTRGDGIFYTNPIWSSGTVHSGGDGIARFIDFDQDGDLDFVTSAPNPRRWVLYRNQDGKVSKKPLWESEETTDCDHIDVLDFNQDGWMDLAATHESHCTLYFNKRGRFERLPDWETDLIANANQIDFGDYDGDGDTDMLMAAGEPINGVALFENTNGTPAKKPTRKLGHAEYCETAVFGDFDGDHDLDVIAHYPSGKTVVYRNSDKDFDEGSTVYDDPANPWTQRHYWYDLEGDGQSELFCAKGPWSGLGASLQLVKRRGSPTLQVQWQSSPNTMFHGFDFGDVDGDGDTDVIAADYANGGYVFLYLNEGGRLADEPAWSVETTGPVHEAVLGDIDLDGDLDLAVGGRDQAHIYENHSITTGFYSPANRARRLLTAEFGFQPSVFTDEQFPECDFLNPDRARRWLGNYEIEVTFYSKAQAVVEKATTSERYGAVVRITAEDGRVYTRFRTLYKTPQPMWLSWGGRLGGELEFPAGIGVDAQTWSQQAQSVNQYVGGAIERDRERSHALAVLLAGLDEMSPEQGPVSQLESAATRDRQWWLSLKRKLNGNGARYTENIIAPVIVDGLDAPVLREGTEEEAGMKPGTVENIHSVLEEWVSNSDQPFNACVARRGVLFFNRAYGSRDGVPITTDTKHVVFSISKALSGSLLMTFVDRGLIRLVDPIEKFLPEFRGSGVETSATLHHLFTHTADMDGHFTDGWNDLEHVYGEAYPYLDIGKQHRYNGTSIAVGLKALEQMTGMTLPQLYQKHLFGPLGCESIESIDGSAMTWSHARDLARVGQMLANRGAYGDLRFFNEATFEQMLPQKLEKLLGPDTDTTWGVGLTWFRGNGLSQRTIGHGSASSCTMRVDLEKDLVITMTRLTAGKNFGRYHPEFIAAVTSGVADRRPQDPTPQELSKIAAAVPARATVKPAKRRRMLVLSYQSHERGRYAGEKALALMAQKTGAYEIVFARDTDALNEMLVPAKLNQYDAVCVNNSTGGDGVSKNGKTWLENLREYVAAGGGLVGIHAATDNKFGEIFGGFFCGHPWSERVGVQIDDPEHPLCRVFAGQGFTVHDEIYQFTRVYSREKLRVLLRLDMTRTADKGAREDDDNAVAWVRSFGEGRVFYCSLGHNHEIFQQPKLMRFYLDGIQFALGDLPADMTPSGPLSAAPVE
jgi:CubicO group peptidase (beta-lactamase class C family)